METFSHFRTISLQHKGDGTRLLSPESECTSCLRAAEQPKTKDLRKSENFKKIPEILGIHGEYPASQSKNKY